MSVLQYYIDEEKIAEKSANWGITITGMKPSIKNTGGPYSDVGIDLFAPYAFTIDPWSFKIVDSFVGFVYDIGTWGELRPRSGDNFLIGAGVIDTGYTGTTKVKIINPYKEAMVFNVGDSIGQLIVCVRAYVEAPTLHLGDVKFIKSIVTERGASGRINTQFNI
jgi:dUTP pyrophosphatase